MGSGMAANTNSKAGIVAKLLEALSAFAHVCKRRIPTVIAVVLLLAVWEAWVRIGNVPSTMIAAPSEIAQATVETWSTLWPATQVTLLEGTVGFLFAVLFGILIGILLYCSCIANAALFPLLSAAQTMPLISIAPLFLIWFGFEISGKIVIVTVFGLFPIAVQTIRGLEAVPQFYSDVALTCGATKAWTLWHVKLRVAARQIYGGIRVSACIHFRHRRHRRIFGRAQRSWHLATGRLQLVPHTADLLGDAGHHRHHRRSDVPGEPQRTRPARPS